VPMGHEIQVGVQIMGTRGGGIGSRLRKYVGSGWGRGSGAWVWLRRWRGGLASRDLRGGARVTRGVPEGARVTCVGATGDAAARARVKAHWGAAMSLVRASGWPAGRMSEN
jgi:hypothetical protein